MTTTAANPVARLIELDMEKRELESRLKEIADERGEIEKGLLDDWAEQGVQRIRQNDHTVYLDSRLSASIKPEDKGRAADVFEAEGLHDMLTVYSQTLSAWVREVGEEEIPERVKEIINVNTVYSIRTRRSN